MRKIKAALFNINTQDVKIITLKLNINITNKIKNSYLIINTYDTDKIAIIKISKTKNIQSISDNDLLMIKKITANNKIYTAKQLNNLLNNRCN